MMVSAYGLCMSVQCSRDRGPRNNAAAWDKQIRKDVEEDATKVRVSKGLGRHVDRRRATLAPS